MTRHEFPNDIQIKPMPESMPNYVGPKTAVQESDIAELRRRYGPSEDDKS